MLDKKNILKSLKSIRPFLQADGGDVELVRFSDDGIVEVKLIGACKDCPLSIMTLRAGIERTLINDVPDIKRIEAVTQ